MIAGEILEEWLIQTDQTNLKEGHYFVIQEAMKEFAELKCKELLEIVAEKAMLIEDRHEQYKEYYLDLGGSLRVDKNSILNAVDLKEFIK